MTYLCIKRKKFDNTSVYEKKNESSTMLWTAPIGKTAQTGVQTSFLISFIMPIFATSLDSYAAPHTPMPLGISARPAAIDRSSQSGHPGFVFSHPLKRMGPEYAFARSGT